MMSSAAGLIAFKRYKYAYNLFLEFAPLSYPM